MHDWDYEKWSYHQYRREVEEEREAPAPWRPIDRPAVQDREYARIMERVGGMVPVGAGDFTLRYSAGWPLADIIGGFRAIGSKTHMIWNQAARRVELRR